MPRIIVHHDGHFFEWSTVVDAPTTQAMPRDEFEAYYRGRYGEAGMQELPRRIGKAVLTGTSSYSHASAEELIEANRAGPGETRLSFEEVIRLVRE
jgi:hypothetical protein